ncbi:MAG: tRNA pseudouridine(55) synthase TruB [Deferribacteres bacterium]|nr:tRNA pseudouridine(55) synthase TruB [Deferribacteres bacterium]
MDAVISINKPRDITSQEAVTMVKRILRVKKAGHTGTLDPMATGLMLVCINRATRLAPYLSGLDKEYRAVMKLGETTDTQDAYGRVIETADTTGLSTGTIEDTLKSFLGRIIQQPPMFSALKHKGRPLYEYARKGIEIERRSREVNIYAMDILNIDFPFVTFLVRCSSGTYIRTLCNDAGRKLGTGAHLFELERTAVGPFKISDSLSFEELKTAATDKGVYTMDEALSWLPELRINETLVRGVTHGNPIRPDTAAGFTRDMETAPGIRIKSPEGELLAIGRFSAAENMIRMKVVFA